MKRVWTKEIWAKNNLAIKIWTKNEFMTKKRAFNNNATSKMSLKMSIMISLGLGQKCQYGTKRKFHGPQKSTTF